MTNCYSLSLNIVISTGKSFIIFLAAGIITACIPFTVNVKPKPLQEIHGKTSLLLYLNVPMWDSLFPNRYGISRKNPDSPKMDFYSLDAFAAAAKKFPDFLGQGSDSTRRRELSAFLANCAQETSGGWADAPGGYYKWGFYFLQEQDCPNGCPTYADQHNKQFPPIPGKSYQGRGPLQLSYNYNYGAFSQAYFGNSQILLQHPGLLDRNAVLSFASAIWFWMHAQPPKPSCHEVMTGKWKPSPADQAAGRKPGFGSTVNIINGGVECGAHPLDKTRFRYRYYIYFCGIFGVSPGKHIQCTNQLPFPAVKLK
ncbi:MAG TPA: chitinase [Chitinophagaceae bacterium]|nr:chitinase [Chitinophagaceae bacterium]